MVSHDLVSLKARVGNGAIKCSVLFCIVCSFGLFVCLYLFRCFHDYRQELALSLLYYLDIGRNYRQK